MGSKRKARALDGDLSEVAGSVGPLSNRMQFGDGWKQPAPIPTRAELEAMRLRRELALLEHDCLIAVKALLNRLARQKEALVAEIEDLQAQIYGAEAAAAAEANAAERKAKRNLLSQASGLLQAVLKTFDIKVGLPTFADSVPRPGLAALLVLNVALAEKRKQLESTVDAMKAAMEAVALMEKKSELAAQLSWRLRAVALLAASQ